LSALTRVLFPAPAEVRNTGGILRWWESRRLTFNAVVGATGLVTLTALKVLAFLPPFSMSLSLSMLWPGIVAYGVLANLFYSLGFMTEAAMQRAWRDETPRVGPPLFRQGLIFSVGLTLLPIAAMGIAKVAMLVKWIIG